MFTLHDRKDQIMVDCEVAPEQNQLWKRYKVWGEVCNENHTTLSCRLHSCLLAVAGQLDLPAQTMSMRCTLTGKLTGKPIDNKRFSTKPVGAERGARARDRQPQTSMDGLCRWRDSNPQPLTGTCF